MDGEEEGRERVGGFGDEGGGDVLVELRDYILDWIEALCKLETIDM